MAIFIKQQDQRSQLQEKIAAELQEKLKTTGGLQDPDALDPEKTTVMQNQHKTRSAGIVIVILLLVAITTLVVKLVLSS